MGRNLRSGEGSKARGWWLKRRNWALGSSFRTVLRIVVATPTGSVVAPPRSSSPTSAQPSSTRLRNDRLYRHPGVRTFAEAEPLVVVPGPPILVGPFLLGPAHDLRRIQRTRLTFKVFSESWQCLVDWRPPAAAGVAPITRPRSSAFHLTTRRLTSCGAGSSGHSDFDVRRARAQRWLRAATS